jgi:uncharacterized protein (TIGR02118 family)
MAPAEFRRYWLEEHGPLMRRYAGALRARRYVQSHTLDTPINEAIRQSRGTAEPYDGITEVWWDGPQALEAALASPEGREADRVLREDEARFVDLSRCRVFITEEHSIFDL